MRVRTVVTGALSLPVLAIYAHSEAHQQHVFAQSGSGDRHQHGHLPKPRVAIIGGGAAGTSSAFFLTHLATADPSLEVDIDLFEANDYIGGRSTVAYPYDNDSYPAIELGASIFVPANKNLWKAAKQFNLTLQSMHGGDDEESDGMAIWNGEDFVYKEGSGYGWWNMAKLFWRYGTSPLTVKNAVSDTVARFLQLYGSEFQSNGPYEGIREYSSALGLDRLAFNSTKAYLKNLAVNELFIDELVAAATRVNYGQDPGHLQAFEGMVSMAANGASSVKGGNRQLFEHFVANSNARVHLNTRVRSIERLQRPETVDALNVALPDPSQRPWLIRYEDIDSGRSAVQAYDAVIFGSPLHSAEASSVPEVQFINADVLSRVPVLPYVDLHVTLLVTNATSPRPEFFNKKGEKISRSILSTFESYEAGRSKTRPTINSLNYLKSLPKQDEETGQRHVVKIFSEYELTEDILVDVFGPTELLWVYRKEWPAYPISPPFDQDFEDLASFKPLPGDSLYYVNAFERWVSTMETETVAAWNCVSLLVKDLFAYQVKRSWAEWDEGEAQCREWKYRPT